jgi:hypothetical protein
VADAKARNVWRPILDGTGRRRALGASDERASACIALHLTYRAENDRGEADTQGHEARRVRRLWTLGPPTYVPGLRSRCSWPVLSSPGS